MASCLQHRESLVSMPFYYSYASHSSPARTSVLTPHRANPQGSKVGHLFGLASSLEKVAGERKRSSLNRFKLLGGGDDLLAVWVDM